MRHKCETDVVWRMCDQLQSARKISPSDRQLPTAAVLSTCASHSPAHTLPSSRCLTETALVPIKRQQDPAHGILWGANRLPAHVPAGVTDYWLLTEPQVERGLSAMTCGQSSGREEWTGPGPNAKMISLRAPPAQLRREQSLSHLAIEEKKKRVLRASSPKSSSRPKNNNITKVIQVHTAGEALGLGGVLIGKSSNYSLISSEWRQLF